MRYSPPTISRLSPGKVAAPGPVTITITGANFGTLSSDLSASLTLAAGFDPNP